MNIEPVRTRLFLENENLEHFVLDHIANLAERTILVIASKIVALSEGRTACIQTEKEKEILVRAESERAVRTKRVWLTLKDGMYMASAGIDESNGNGKWILLPKDSYQSAEALRIALSARFGVRDLGVVVVDSCPLPLRRGVVGMALGYAGFSGVKEYNHKKDIFGRGFSYTSVNIADSLAVSAMMLMGEGDERQPLALIHGAPISFCPATNRDELRIDPEEDMFGPLFS